MRLRESQKIINNNIGKIKIVASSIGTNPPTYKLENLVETKKALDQFSIITPLQKDIELLRSTSIYGTAQDYINVSGQENTQIQSALGRISSGATLLLQTYDDALHDKQLGPEAVSIKIPVINDFDELSELINKFKKSLSLPVSELQEGGGQIKILNFDSGTFWIDILLPSTISVSLLGSIAWAGAVIFKKYQEAFAFKAYAESLDVQKDHLGNLQKAAKKLLDLQVETEAKLIQEEFYKNDDKEQLGRLKLSIKEMSELIGKGVEIQPSIAASEQITNLFPNYKLLSLIESKVKQIGN